MALPIQVPAGFKDDFNFYCERAGIVGAEQSYLRNAVREDFAKAGKWVQECAVLYRFVDETWGGYMPTPDLCSGYLASKGQFFEDENLFDRLGILLQVRMCAKAAGVLDQAAR